MRYLELLITDVTHQHAPATRTEWVHRDHIETIEPYLHHESGRAPMLWLQLTLTTGRTRYIPLHPVQPEHADDAARAAITDLFEHGQHPVHAAVLDLDDDEFGHAAPPPRLNAES